MSVEHIVWVLNCSESIGTERLLLVGIANHADEDGEAWPGINTLAEYCNVSESAARRGLQRLQADGRVKIEKNAGGTRRTQGNRRPNRYTLLGSDGERVTLNRAKSEVAPTRPQSPEGEVASPEPEVAPTDSGVASGTVRGRVAATPKPSLNPQIEPSEEQSSPSAPRSCDELFAEWWARYPKSRRVAKDKCQAAFARIVKAGVSAEEILAGLDRWLAHWTASKTEERFIKHTTSWLNERRWEVELDVPATNAAPAPEKRPEPTPPWLSTVHGLRNAGASLDELESLITTWPKERQQAAREAFRKDSAA